MNSTIRQKLAELQQLTSRLIYPDENTECYIVDNWQHIHSRISLCSAELYPVKGADVEEEATICLALLMSYAASVCRDEDKVQCVLNRTHNILSLLGSSLLKCRLLTFCYTEVGEKQLLAEALSIAECWKAKPLLEEERQIMETLTVLSGELN
ncbi:UpxZ family transcription anti-terminator antagonist [Phocaeicola sp.]